MSNPFKAGDRVEFVKQDVCAAWLVTHRKIYRVDNVKGEWVRVIRDDGSIGGIHYRHFHLYTRSQAAPATHQPRYHVPLYPDHTAAILGTDDEPEEEEDYDTRKANASVTSAGSFEKGDKVVYKDGTPIPTEYGYFRVTRCTATAVWFEHCYSMPFNPNEFKRA